MFLKIILQCSFTEAKAKNYSHNTGKTVLKAMSAHGYLVCFLKKILSPVMAGETTDLNTVKT